MPIAYRIIRAKDFVQTTATGNIDVDVSKKILLNVASLVKTDPASFNILLDVSDAYTVMTEEELTEIVNELYDRRSLFPNKIAIVFSGDNIALAKFVESFGRREGLQINFFLEIEQAIDWLNDYTYFSIDYDTGDEPD